MDPISLGLLSALAGGLGGEAGKGAWSGLKDLVALPFTKRSPEQPEISSVHSELVALEGDPASVQRADLLDHALRARAQVDPAFTAGLEAWRDQVSNLRLEKSSVQNSVTGGHQQTVVQGRDFRSITFGAPGRAEERDA